MDEGEPLGSSLTAFWRDVKSLFPVCYCRLNTIDSQWYPQLFHSSSVHKQPKGAVSRTLKENNGTDPWNRDTPLMSQCAKTLVTHEGFPIWTSLFSELIFWNQGMRPGAKDPGDRLPWCARFREMFSSRVDAAKRSYTLVCVPQVNQTYFSEYRCACFSEPWFFLKNLLQWMPSQ